MRVRVSRIRNRVRVSRVVRVRRVRRVRVRG